MGYIYIHIYLFFFSTCLVDMWHTFFGYASFLFFLLSCLLGMWHTFFGYASFISFCIAHILDGNLGERVMIELGVLFCEWMEMLAIWEWTCMWSWSWEYDKSLTRVKVFDKTQSKVKLHMKVWAWTSNFGFGRNSLIWGDKLLMIFFWKEIPSTLQGRAWFHSSNHITLVNYLDSMGSLWRYIYIHRNW